MVLAVVMLIAMVPLLIFIPVEGRKEWKRRYDPEQKGKDE